MIDALKSWPIVLLAAAVVLIVVVRGAVVDHIEGVRKQQGYELCEDKIREDLKPGYDPVIKVYFYERNPSGDFLYDALADDGDGDWSCEVAWVDGKPSITTSTATYRSSDQHYDSDWPGADRHLEP